MPGKGRKRPRFSIPSNGWRLLDEPASPTRDQPSSSGGDWMDTDEEDLERSLQDAEEANLDNEIRDQHHMTEDERITGAATAEKEPVALISIDENVQADVSDNLPAESVGDAKSPHPVEQAAPNAPQPEHPPSVPIQVISSLEDHSEYSADRGDRLPTPSPIVSTSTSAVGHSLGPSSAQQDHPNALVPEDTSNDLQATEMAVAPEVEEHPPNEDDHSKNVEMSDNRAEEMAVDVQQAVPPESQFEFVPQVSGFTAMNVDRSSVSQTVPSQGDSETNFTTVRSNEDQTKLTDVEVVQPDTTSISGDEDQEERDEVEVEEQREADDEDEEEEEGEEEEEELEELEDDEHEVGDEADAEQEEAMDEKHQENEVISIVSDETSEANDAETSAINVEKQAELDEESDEDDRSDQLGNVPRETYDVTDASEYDEDEDDEHEEQYDEDVSEDEYESEEDVSEAESDQEDEGDVVRPQQQQQPQRTVHPEVIVIDSDSDEEPAPPPAQARQDVQPNQPSEDIRLSSPRAMQQESDYRSTEESDSEDEEVAESEAEQELSDDYGQQEETVTSEVDASSDAEPRSDEEEDELVEESMPVTDDHVSQDGDNYIPPENEDGKSQAQAVATESLEAAIHPELLGTQSSFGVNERLSGPEQTRDEQRPPEASQDVFHDTNQAPSDEEAMSTYQATEDSKDKTHSVSHLESGQQLISPEPTQLDQVNRTSTHQTASGTWIPTPQATQDAETHPRSQEPLAGPSSHAEHAPDKIEPLERHTTASPSRPRWTDGPSYSPSPQQRAEDIHTHPAGNREDGNIGDVDAAQDNVDEAVQVDEDSTRESVDTERASPEALKGLPQPNRRATGLRSRVSYFAPLATLVDWFNSMTDTISVAVEVSPVARATSGPRDYYLTLRLTDPSMAGTTLPAQIFRTNKTALPAVSEGDVILLRNFKVQSFNHSMMLLSTDSSAWAVFHGDAEEPRVTGPPVEYGPEERTYVADLQNWYCKDGAAMVADYMLQSSIDRGIMEESSSSVAPSEVGSIDSSLRGSSSVQRSRRGKRYHRRITIHELRDGRKYPEVGSPSDRDSIHELRDGTVYAHSFETD